jgi:hypothetical protein
MSLEHIKAFNRDMTITVTRAGQKEKILVFTEGGTAKEYLWDGKNPLTITL